MSLTREEVGRNSKVVRVLIIAPSLDILGGQAVQAACLLDRLAKEPGIKVGFLAVNPRLPGGLRKLQSIKYVRTIVTSIAYFASLLNRVRHYDVVHIFSASYSSFLLAPTPAILVGKLYGKKLLLNYHSGEAEDHLRRWRRSAIPTIRLADELIVSSAYLVRVFAKFGLPAKAIYNLIEIDRFRFRERRPLRPIFLSNRNFERHYGIDSVLRAFAIIQEQVPEARLIIAGDGAERASLEQLARDLHLRNADFTGRVGHEKVFELYDSTDIFLNGSEIDNQPLSLLEAFACGLPVVTTDAGGILDLVVPEKTALVSPTGDYEQLAANALRLLNDSVLAQTIIEQASAECIKYQWGAVGDQWLNSYYELAWSSGEPAIAPKRKKYRQEPLSLIPLKMAKLPKLVPNWKKTKHLRFDELHVRAAQKLATLAERSGLSSLNKLPSDAQFAAMLDHEGLGRELSSADKLLEHFRSRTVPKFFAGLDAANARKTIEQLRTRWPRAKSDIVGRAEHIVEGQFDLLGFRGLNFGESIDWHLEPVSGKRTPLTHWSRLDYLDAEIAGDKKIVWELNRHQYFTTLGQAYWLTGDERYAQTFAAHLESWMDQNPPKLGINWASSLEVAFRSISWLWAFYFFKDSALFSPRTFIRAVKFLYLNARHLETYLSTYFSPNTHLTGEALGLFYLGILLPEFKDAERWRQTGKRILLEQLPIHVRPDGVYFEQSSYYHRYTADFYAHFLILARANAEAVSEAVDDRLRSLLDHLMYITRPDGTTPLFGDDDGGKLMTLNRCAANDFRATLSTGAALFERPDYKFVAAGPAEETLWLLGVEGLQQLDRIVSGEPSKQSVAFESGGYYVMRDGWTAKSNYLLFDCGPHGQANCGHAHADALAFELATNGRTLLVDPGTYTYTGAKDLRDWFRGSSAHNTLIIDQQPSSVSAGPFSWKSVARCEPRAWISRERFDYVAGAHDGYAALPQPAEHDRSILFLKREYWVVRDHIKSDSEQLVDLWFHFEPDSDPLIEATAEQPAFIAEVSGETGLDLYAFAENSRWRREDGWVSHCYGQRDPSRVYAFSTLLGETRNAFTLLLPRSAGSRWRVREIEAIGGQAFEVANENWLDIVMIRTGERIETARIASDFEWTWVRFPKNVGQLPEEFVLLGGQSLEVDGRGVLKSSRLINHLTGHRLGDDFRVETDEGVSILSVFESDPDQNRQSAFGIRK